MSGLQRVLVANRGEIACRIIRTLRRLGIASVAVHSDADLGSAHVAMADEAVRIGPAPARSSYLDVDALLGAARATGADGVHPGYGFLSENAAFAEAVEGAGLAFIGPTPEQLRTFGEKHLAREAARRAGVPLAPGTDLVSSLEEALAGAEQVGYPVMLKAAAGGGGIGMAPCAGADELVAAYERVRHLAEASFGSSAVFLERFVPRARHVEVQVFGDGAGRAVALGERDCSVQRRNQKVVEESPAPGLAPELRERLHAAAVALAEDVGYRSAGTVELLLDADSGELSFLEVNARLQVEHPVTEATWGVDLVEWMVRLAGGDAGPLEEHLRSGRRAPDGHAVEVRLYAEDAARGNRPSPGLLTEVHLPEGPGTRVDSWVATGTEVSPHYDPLLAKVVAHGATRQEAIDRLAEALDRTRVAGVETNLPLLRHVLGAPWFREGRQTTASLAGVELTTATVEVLAPGTSTTVQDHPGRRGLWHVGVPPSGPMDDRSHRLANRAVGNDPGAPALELTVSGPTLRFAVPAVVCLAGAWMPARLDGADVPWWEPVEVPAGGVLEVGTAPGPGLRATLAVRGGFDVPPYLGSASTFTLGCFGGHGGRALVAGDVLRLAAVPPGAPAPRPVPAGARPELTHRWELAVVEGPHGDPEFLTPDDLDQLYSATWSVHHNSARTGVRLVGPRPRWARPDGGEAGLHPSNIHDTPYAVGSVDLTGDMPILLGPDGPSLGGFVCPAVVAQGDRWKLGQLRPGDEVRLVPVGAEAAGELRRHAEHVLADPEPGPGPTLLARRAPEAGVLARREADGDLPELTLRRSGDDHLLVEYGPMVLDLAVRLRVHTLMTWVEQQGLDGLIDLTPGIRSLQLHVDPDRLSVERAADLVVAAQRELPPTDEIEVPSRVVHLPLSWDDPATREAIERYTASVRDDAPWCPWNIEFIRRINGLESVDDVHRTVFDASYLVLGLGDVYLGAPVATPVDPRHRLVTTKYNPARTWTPENAVGIGGAYLCIYGMEGPGGYQLVGRTVQVWNRFHDTPHAHGDQRWLLRFFDRIHWYPVSHDELADLRARLPLGRVELQVEEGTFRLTDHRRSLEREADSIAAFRSRQRAAFAAERAAWEASGELNRLDEPPPPPGADAVVEVPPGGTVVSARLAANVWQVPVGEGEQVREGDVVVVLEAMKTETAVRAPCDGRWCRWWHRPVPSCPPAAPCWCWVRGEARPVSVAQGASPDPEAAARRTLAAIAASDRPEVWIHRPDDEEVLREAAAVAARLARGEHLPLAGLTAAVKGNIDVAGWPTTAACPAFASVPDRSATAVDRLRAAGAVVVGSTNLDQFATGLVGTRSPHGAVRHPLDPAYVSGGSSSGSAAAVALGLVDLALGTDTAGSGRVPAAFCGLVGLKPTRGLVSTRGVVPAVRPLDCVSVLERSVAGAARALAALAGPDPQDPWSRTPPPEPPPPGAGRVGVPTEGDLDADPHLDDDTRRALAAAAERLRERGVEVVEVPTGDLVEAGSLLYGGAVVAERYASVGAFVESHADDVDPTVLGIIRAAGRVPAHALAADQHRIRELAARFGRTWAGVGALLVPTAPTHPTIAEVAADPLGVNAALGRWTNGANLLDLCAAAVPAGRRDDGRPLGVTLYGPAWADERVARLAARLLDEPEPPATASGVLLAVVGAHLRGEPLNHLLTSRGGELVATTTTSPEYRLHALPLEPPRPGLVRVGGAGAAVEVEVWRLPVRGFGAVVAEVPSPLAIGRVRLADGSEVAGFLCEALAAEGTPDITGHGGWRAYRASGRAPAPGPG